VIRRKAKSKYGNVKKVNSGLIFDSKRESSRWSQLVLMEKAGVISQLERQITFELIPKQRLSNGKCERALKYILDFRYVKDGVTIFDDSKGKRTADYVIKRKLMLYVHGIEILET
jgi:hypothetical protein